MAPYRVLAIGAHPDDIELGCGGAIARHVAVGHDVTMLVMTNGLSGPGDVDGRVSEAQRAAELIGARIEFGGLHDGAVDSSRETVQIIEKFVTEIQPSAVYTHGPSDTHQDHRNVSAATVSAARSVATLLYYQSPSAQVFHPNFFVALDDAALQVKMEALNCHSSQVESSTRVDFDALEASARYWGLQVRTRYAESFELVRGLANPTGFGMLVGERRMADRTENFDGVERRGKELPQYSTLFDRFAKDIDAMREEEND